MRIRVSHLLRFVVEGETFSASPSPYPQEIPEKFQADPHFAAAIASGWVVPELEVRPEAQEAAPVIRKPRRRL